MTDQLRRRSILKSAGALGGVLLAPALPMWALADELLATASQSDIDTFSNLSAALLGIDVKSLVPDLIQDDLSLAALYYSVPTATQTGAEFMEGLLVYYQELVDANVPPPEIAKQLLTDSKGKPNESFLGVYSRLTMMMWLYGIWYGSTEVTTLPSSKQYVDAGYQTDFIVSARAYKNSWIWRIAQAHPMAFSTFSFGSWADQPPSLADYGISI
ncbi:hypothetical protein [Pelagibius sp. Alg239-R121]|uniref:hypothetical protein n=1 Tax=Pelagibius sp. Alg239-R121 TaxID=2993448 RepID=UPI0024A755A8|nr:hypothetical protein [Pelagibius sp. Alg239-R121]